MDSRLSKDILFEKLVYIIKIKHTARAVAEPFFISKNMVMNNKLKIRVNLL